MTTITSANSALTLAVDPIFPNPRTIQGFGVDAAFSADAVEIGGIRIGIDGLSASYFVFRIFPFHITLLPNSPSLSFFDDWATRARIIRDTFVCNGTLSLPSIGRKYTLSNGTLTNIPVLPEAREYLNDLSYTIGFTNIIPETL